MFSGVSTTAPDAWPLPGGGASLAPFSAPRAARREARGPEVRAQGAESYPLDSGKNPWPPLRTAQHLGLGVPYGARHLASDWLAPDEHHLVDPNHRK
jgi:hypothetical protein